MASEVLLRNALIVVPVCVMAAALCWLAPRRPAIQHALWLVVLLTFVAPPMPGVGPVGALALLEGIGPGGGESVALVPLAGGAEVGAIRDSRTSGALMESEGREGVPAKVGASGVCAGAGAGGGVCCGRRGRRAGRCDGGDIARRAATGKENPHDHATE
jgi:hypothetical protein